MPTTAMPSPTNNEARPLTVSSVTTVDVAANANTASAKNSAGPNCVEKSASTGARNTTPTEATMPPMKAPIAAVARAFAALPSSAILCPSNVEAMADAWPGVFIRMPMVESPNRPPK